MHNGQVFYAIMWTFFVAQGKACMTGGFHSTRKLLSFIVMDITLLLVELNIVHFISSKLREYFFSNI